MLSMIELPDPRRATTGAEDGDSSDGAWPGLGLGPRSVGSRRGAAIADAASQCAGWDADSPRQGVPPRAQKKQMQGVSLGATLTT